MTPKEQYQQAVAHIQAKEYQKAKRILERMNHPKAAELLAKVNAAIAKQPKKKGNTALKVFIVFGIAFGIVTAGYFVWQNFVTTTREIYGVLALELSCGLLYPDSDAECEAEAERIFRDFPAETQECTEESQTGTQQYIMRSCLERHGIAFEIDDSPAMPNSR